MIMKTSLGVVVLSLGVGVLANGAQQVDVVGLPPSFHRYEEVIDGAAMKSHASSLRGNGPLPTKGSRSTEVPWLVARAAAAAQFKSEAESNTETSHKKIWDGKSDIPAALNKYLQQFVTANPPAVETANPPAVETGNPPAIEAAVVAGLHHAEDEIEKLQKFLGIPQAREYSNQYGNPPAGNAHHVSVAKEQIEIPEAVRFQEPHHEIPEAVRFQEPHHEIPEAVRFQEPHQPSKMAVHEWKMGSIRDRRAESAEAPLEVFGIEGYPPVSKMATHQPLEHYSWKMGSIKDPRPAEKQIEIPEALDKYMQQFVTRNPPAVETANPPAVEKANPPAVEKANPPAVEKANPPMVEVPEALKNYLREVVYGSQPETPSIKYSVVSEPQQPAGRVVEEQMVKDPKDKSVSAEMIPVSIEHDWVEVPRAAEVPSAPQAAHDWVVVASP